MTVRYDPEFRSRIHAERTLLMLPINVVMAARVSGDIDVDDLKTAAAALRKRHALLAVRVTFDVDGTGWYVTDGVPETPLRVVEDADPDAWLHILNEEAMTSFPIEAGPLVRFTVVRASEKNHLVVVGHHAVCDATSLTYLIRDVLQQLVDPNRDVAVLPPPPPIDQTTVEKPPKMNFIARWFVSLMNWKWSKQKLAFTQDDMTEMHRAFWEKNGEPTTLAWELTEKQTKALVARCRMCGSSSRSEFHEEQAEHRVRNILRSLHSTRSRARSVMLPSRSTGEP